MTDVLEANNFPGAICSMICGGSDIGYDDILFASFAVTVLVFLSMQLLKVCCHYAT